MLKIIVGIALVVSLISSGAVLWTTVADAPWESQEVKAAPISTPPPVSLSTCQELEQQIMEAKTEWSVQLIVFYYEKRGCRETEESEETNERFPDSYQITEDDYEPYP